MYIHTYMYILFADVNTDDGGRVCGCYIQEACKVVGILF